VQPSFKKAVLYCIENNILKEFLESNASEIFNMLTDDITIEEIAEIRAEEAREEGIEEQARNDGSHHSIAWLWITVDQI